MSNLYVDVDALKKTLAIDGTTYADDDVMLAIEAASRAIDEICDRVFYSLDPSNDDTRYYTTTGPLTLHIDDLIALTSVDLDADDDGSFETPLVRATDFVLEPLNAANDGRPWERLRLLQFRSTIPRFRVGQPGSVRIVGRFGWATTPSQVKQAAGLLAARLLKLSRDAPFGVVALGADGSAVTIGRSSPDVMALLARLATGSTILG